MKQTTSQIKQKPKLRDELTRIAKEKALILDNINEIIAYHDLDHRLLWVNKKYQTATGLKLEDVQGKKCYKAWGLAKLCIGCPVTIAIETGTAVDAELTPENQPHWPSTQGCWAVNAAPVEDEAGKIIGAIEMASEITEQKDVEEALRLQSTIVTNMAEAVYLIRMDNGEIVYTNPAFERMFGYKPDEMLGQDVAIVNAPTDLDPADTVKAIMVQLEKDGYWEGEVNNIKKNGTHFWCNAQVTLYDHLEYGTVLISVHTDITKSKEAEAEKEKILHSKGERVKELQCMYSVIESIQKRNTLEAIFQDVADLIPPGWHYPEITRGKVVFDRKKYVSKPFKETKWKQSSDIVVNKEKRGSIEVYYMEECPELDDGPFMKEERALISGISRNISGAIERKQVEEARTDLLLEQQRLVDELSLKNTSLQEFAYVAVHDLKSPINNLQSLMYMIESEDGVKKESKVLFEKVAISIKHLEKKVKLLNEAINITRVVTHNEERLSFDTTLKEIIESNTELIEEAKATIVTDFTKCTYVQYPDIHLRSIMQNLLTNALKYRRPKVAPVIKFTTELKNGITSLSVADNGLGIDLKLHKDKLFGLFKRFHPEVAGVGIGLYMINSIVRSHNGHIKVTSEVNKGTEFQIKLNDEKH